MLGGQPVDVFDSPIFILIGFNGPASFAGADNPALTIEFGGLVLVYS